MNKKVILLMCGLLVAACGETPTGPETFEQRLQEASSRPVEVEREDGQVVFVAGEIAVPTASATTPEAAAAWFLDEFSDGLGVTDPKRDLVASKLKEDPDSTDAVVVHDRVEDGVPVFGADVSVEVIENEDGTAVRTVFSRVPDDLEELNTTPGISREEATRVAETGGNSAVQTELMILDPGMFGGMPGSVLVYRVILSDTGLRTPPVVFVNAQTGEILSFSYPLIQEEKVTRRVRSNEDKCTDRGDDELPIIYEEAGLVKDAKPSDDATEGYGNAKKYWDYLWTTFKRDSYDGAGSMLHFIVDTRDELDDGSCVVYDNAFWSSTRQVMVFGLGNTSLDTTGHEITHAVVNSTAGLVYANRSGALNESYADVFGAMLDGNWELGETEPNGVYRSLKDPASGGDPAHEDDFVVSENTSDGDWGGVHTNSGIPNYAAYLAAVGGNSVKDPKETVRGIGNRKLEQAYFRALTLYLGPSSNFKDSKRALRTAAKRFVEKKLHAYEYKDCASLINAYAAVGIGVGDADEDCYDDEADNCPMVFNPEQDEQEECKEQMVPTDDACEVYQREGPCDLDSDCNWCKEEATLNPGCHSEACVPNPCFTQMDEAMCETVDGCDWCDGVTTATEGCKVECEPNPCLGVDNEAACEPIEGCNWCGDANPVCQSQVCDPCTPLSTTSDGGMTFSTDCESCLALPQCQVCAFPTSTFCDLKTDACTGTVVNECVPDEDPCAMFTDDGCDACNMEEGCGFCGALGCISESRRSECADDWRDSRSKCVPCDAMDCATCRRNSGFCGFCSGSGGCKNLSVYPSGMSCGGGEYLASCN